MKDEIGVERTTLLTGEKRLSMAGNWLQRAAMIVPAVTADRKPSSTLTRLRNRLIQNTSVRHNLSICFRVAAGPGNKNESSAMREKIAHTNTHKRIASGLFRFFCLCELFTVLYKVPKKEVGHCARPLDVHLISRR